MSNTVHKKILPEYFDLVKKGIKKFELRKAKMIFKSMIF